MLKCRAVAARAWSLVALLLGLFVPALASAADFDVTNQAMSAWLVTPNGGTQQTNPALTLVRGHTYTFNVNAGTIHPFFIKTAAVTGTGSTFDTGVTGNGTSTGTVTFAVPVSAPNALFYQCSNHAAMTGALQITSPPVPLLGPAGLSAALLALLGARLWLLRRRLASSPAVASR